MARQDAAAGVGVRLDMQVIYPNSPCKFSAKFLMQFYLERKNDEEYRMPEKFYHFNNFSGGPSNTMIRFLTIKKSFMKNNSFSIRIAV